MSRKEIYVCDCCGKEIPIIKKKDILGIEREYLQSGHLEALHSVGKNLSMFGIDFCKDCVHKIDIEIMEWKMSVLNNYAYSLRRFDYDVENEKWICNY